MTTKSTNESTDEINRSETLKTLERLKNCRKDGMDPNELQDKMENIMLEHVMKKEKIATPEFIKETKGDISSREKLKNTLLKLEKCFSEINDDDELLDRTESVIVDHVTKKLKYTCITDKDRKKEKLTICTSTQPQVNDKQIIPANKFNGIITFNGNDIPVLEIDDEFWFEGKGIAKILGYTNTKKALSINIKSDFKKSYSKLTLNKGSQKGPLKKVHSQTIYINENGLYKLIMKSTNSEAEEFTDWVTDRAFFVLV